MIGKVMDFQLQKGPDDRPPPDSDGGLGEDG